MVSLKFNTLATIVGFLLAVSALATSTGDAGATYPTVRDIIPKEYIKQVLEYHGALAEEEKRNEWRNAKRTLSRLQKRVPGNSLCHPGTTWVGRDCLADVNEREYQDMCRHNNPPNDIVEWEWHCDDGYLCVPFRTLIGQDHEGEDEYEHDIICRKKKVPSQDMVDRDRKRQYDSQYGYRLVNSETDLIQDMAIPIYVFNPIAVVSGEILNFMKTKVMPTVGTLTANLRGFQENLCHQNLRNVRMHNTRQCLPTGKHSVNKKQIIDYTFSVPIAFSGFLFYSIA